MEKVIETLRDILPGDYECFPNVNSFSYRVVWKGRYNSEAERVAVYDITHLELMNANGVELAYKIRDELLKDLKDPGAILDLLMGKL